MDSFEKKLYIKNFVKYLAIESIDKFTISTNLVNLGTCVICDSLSTGFDGFDVTAIVASTLTSIINFSALYSIDRKVKNVIRGIPRKEHKEYYLKCLRLYKEYLNRYCDLLSKINFKDDLELCLFLDKCFQSAVFTSTGEANYCKYDIDYDRRYLDLLGTRVLTGNSVCRHNTAFSVDVLRNFGKNAYYLPVSTVNNEERILYNDFPFIANHAITGIVENGKKFAYDFTWHVDSYFNSDKSFKFSVSNKDNLYLSDYLLRKISEASETSNGYILIRRICDVEIFKEFYPAEVKEFKDVDTNMYDALSDILFKRNYCMLRNFFEDNQDLVSDISKLNKILMPAYNKKEKRK